MYYNEHFHSPKILPTPNFFPSPKNLILMIGDGMGLGHISAAKIANKGQLNLQHFKHIGLMGTSAADEFITDSAAAATAIATGQKTKNGAVGVNAKGKRIPNLREILVRKKGMKTGVISCCSVTEATPAAFVAHQIERMFHEDIALDFLDSGIDFFFGEGRDYFIERDDLEDLSLKLAAKGYQVLQRADELEFVKNGKVAGLVESCPSMEDGRGDYLQQVSKEAIRLLDQGSEGFFLMIEGSQIDWAAHGNESEGVIQELLDFDRCLGDVLEFAAQDGETLVVVTSDHETGGMTVHDGNEEVGKVEGAFTTIMHTGIMVPVFAFGPQADLFLGMYENTELFHRLKKAVMEPQNTLASVS